MNTKEKTAKREKRQVWQSAIRREIMYHHQTFGNQILYAASDGCGACAFASESFETGWMTCHMGENATCDGSRRSQEETLCHHLNACPRFRRRANSNAFDLFARSARSFVDELFSSCEEEESSIPFTPRFYSVENLLTIYTQRAMGMKAMGNAPMDAYVDLWDPFVEFITDWIIRNAKSLIPHCPTVRRYYVETTRETEGEKGTPPCE